MCRTFISSIDLFGKAVIINLAGKEKLKSFFGGTCSLFFFGFLIWATYDASNDLFSTINPNTVSAESYNENPREMILTPDNFPLGFGIQAPDSLGFLPYNNQSIFKIQFLYNRLQKTLYQNGTIQENWTYIPLSTETCTPEYFGQLASSFTEINLESTYCISREQPEIKTIQLRGSFETLIFESINVLVSQCDNATSEVICAPQEVLDEYLSGGWFNFLHTNMVVNPHNYSRPNSRYRDIYYTMISPANYKNTVIQLGHVEMTTDSGWVVENLVRQSFVKVNKINEDLQFKPHPEKILISCSFEVSKLENYYSRSYKKVQNVLAEVGGLANTALVIIFVLTSPYLNLKLNESLINELFNIKLTETKGKTNYKKSQLNKKKVMVNYKKDKSSLISEENNLKIENIKAIISTDVYLKTENQTLERFSIKSPKMILDDPLITPPINIKKIRSETSNHNMTSSTYHVTPNFSRIKNETEGEPNSPSQEVFFRRGDLAPLSSLPSSFRKLKGKVNTYVTQNQGAQIRKNSCKIDQKILKEVEEGDLDFSNSFLDEVNDTGQINKIKGSSVENTSAKENNQELKREIELHTESQKSHQNEFEQEKRTDEVQQEEEGIFIQDNTNSVRIDLSFWQYVCSFLYRTKTTKEKMMLLSKGAKNINARLDVINIMKKLREVDKLKALLFDANQLVLFNNLPKPEISLEKPGQLERKSSFAHGYLKKPTLFDDTETMPDMKAAYMKITKKTKKTKIDQKLLEIFQVNSF